MKLWFEYENEIEDRDEATHEIIKELCDMMDIEHLPENLRVESSLEGHDYYDGKQQFMWGILIREATEEELK